MCTDFFLEEEGGGGGSIQQFLKNIQPVTAYQNI